MTGKDDLLKPDEGFENIELSLPVNAAYVTTVRQTASTIAGRLGFDADEVEDLRTAVSEACTYIIKKLEVNPSETFKITFSLQPGFINVGLSVRASALKDGADDDYSLTMINALMERVSTAFLNGFFHITMEKTHEASVL